MAIQLGTQHPQIVKAVTNLTTAMEQAQGRYYQVLHALRAAKLQKKENTALLLGLGFHKSRVSQLCAMASVSDDVWAKYSAKTIGFRAALELENGGGDDTPEVEVVDPEAENGRKRARAKIYPVPKGIQTALAAAVEHWEKPNKGGNRTEYGLTVERDGITLYFQIFADKAD